MSTSSRAEEGSTSLLGLLVATSVFILSFSAIVQVSLRQEKPDARIAEADLTAIAASLADVLLGSPGNGWYEADDACPTGSLDLSRFQPEAVTRLGLAEEPCAEVGGVLGARNNLSYQKLLNLNRAVARADPTNGFVDYEEALESLALDLVHLDFHLRAWPMLPSVEEALREGKQDPNLRALYVGDYEEQQGSGEAVYEVEHAAGAAATADHFTSWVNITNNGTKATAFTVTFRLQTAHEIVWEKHGPVIQPGAWGNVSASFNKSSDWQWRAPADPRIDYAIRDPSKVVGEGSLSLAATETAASSARIQLLVEAGALEYEAGSARVGISYDALDGAGSSNVAYAGWSLEILDETGAPVASSGNLQNKGGTARFDLSAAGEYRVRLLGGPGWTAQEDRFHVTDPPLERFTPAPTAGQWVPQAPVVPEASLLELLLVPYDFGVPSSDFAHPDVPFLAGGDIAPDDNRFLGDFLDLMLRNAQGQATLDEYNVVVVGSGVDHRTLTSAAIKYTIRDWVLAGGTLVVFGSEEQAVQWLQPIFHVALESAGGGLSLPDENNPILTTPNPIDSSSFADFGTAWHFTRQEDKSHFTHVVVRGEDDVLAVSDPGAFGDGRVILTSWRPFSLLPDGNPDTCHPTALDASCPSLRLVHNFLTIGYRGLYLDYGPPTPDFVPQGAQSRIPVVYHAEMKQMIELRFYVFVFG